MVGVLHARTGEGTSVAPDSSKLLGRIVRWRLVTEQQDLENLMEVRIALEGLSVRSFALHASDADIRHLEGLHGEMAAALQREDARSFLAIDLEFHLFIGRASGNSLLYDLILTIRGQLAEGLKRVLARQSTLPVALKEHGLILETVRQRDPDGAQAAMNVHLYGGLERYRKMHKADRDGMKPVPRKKKTQTSAQ
jgi:GntR family transcriptional repressor for pyruvate dehydrogenase complex